MSVASHIGGKLSGGGIFGTIQEKGKNKVVRMPRSQSLGIPIVVIVNGGTASVAELMAGSLRDNGVATLVGTRTFGDGTTQTPLLLKDGSAAIVTTGTMLTTKGTAFDGKGLVPERKYSTTKRTTLNSRLQRICCSQR